MAREDPPAIDAAFYRPDRHYINSSSVFHSQILPRAEGGRKDFTRQSRSTFAGLVQESHLPPQHLLSPVS